MVIRYNIWYSVNDVSGKKSMAAWLFCFFKDHRMASSEYADSHLLEGSSDLRWVEIMASDENHTVRPRKPRQV